MKRNACQKCAFAVRDDNPHCGLRGFTTSFNVEWCESENDKAPNGYELQEDGYFSWVKKGKKYPTTIEECCKILGLEFNPFYTGVKRQVNYKDGLLHNLKCLLIYRDAYWKLYGDEMGLDGLWEPDWDAKDNHFYTIHTFNGKIECSATAHRNAVLIFPTAEMRNAFYENFKDLIEECKEFL